MRNEESNESADSSEYIELKNAEFDNQDRRNSQLKEKIFVNCLFGCLSSPSLTGCLELYLWLYIRPVWMSCLGRPSLIIRIACVAIRTVPSCSNYLSDRLDSHAGCPNY